MKWWMWIVLLPKAVWAYFRVRKYFQTKAIANMEAVQPVQQNQFGIEESEKLVRVIAGVYKAVRNVDENHDGKVSGNEVFKAASDVVYKGIQNFPNLLVLKQEAKDYVEQEKTALAGLFAQEIEEPIAKATHLFEAGAKIVFDVFDFIVDANKPHSAFEPML